MCALARVSSCLRTLFHFSNLASCSPQAVHNMSGGAWPHENQIVIVNSEDVIGFCKDAWCHVWVNEGDSQWCLKKDIDMIDGEATS